MTDSTNEKPTPQQHRLDAQKEDFDFDLVEVQVIPDQENPMPSPLDHVMDDTTPDNQAQTDTHNPNESLIPPAQKTSEIKTNFYVDYFDQRKKIKKTYSEPTVAAQVHQSSTIENSSQDAEEAHPSAPSQPIEEASVDNSAPIVNGSGMAVAVLSQFKSKQESINKQQEKLIQEFSGKIKKATTVTYTAVFFGMAAFAAATVLGVMLLKTKSELSDLVGTTTALKDDIRNIKTSPDDLEGTDPALDQLNQKVDDVAEQLNEVAALQNKQKMTTEKQPSTKSQPQEQVTIVEKTEPVVKTTPIVKTVKNSHTEQTITVVDIPEKKPSSKTVKNATTGQTTPTNVTATKPQNNSKPTNKTVTTKKDSEIIDKALAVPENDINKIANNAAPQTSRTAATPQTSRTAATPQPSNNASPQAQTSQNGWTVNLASSNKLEDAKKTAASYAQKGVPVTITPVTVKNETRYRLQVKGFKNKDEATAYANKAKAALKLNAVWINP